MIDNTLMLIFRRNVGAFLRAIPEYNSAVAAPLRAVATPLRAVVRRNTSLRTPRRTLRHETARKEAETAH